MIAMTTIICCYSGSLWMWFSAVVTYPSACYEFVDIIIFYCLSYWDLTKSFSSFCCSTRALTIISMFIYSLPVSSMSLLSDSSFKSAILNLEEIQFLYSSALSSISISFLTISLSASSCLVSLTPFSFSLISFLSYSMTLSLLSSASSST